MIESGIPDHNIFCYFTGPRIYDLSAQRRTAGDSILALHLYRPVVLWDAEFLFFGRSSIICFRFFYGHFLFYRNLFSLFRIKHQTKKQLVIYTPLHPSVLRFSLITFFLIALGIAIYRILEFGIPLFERNWYTAGIESSTGVLNRLLFNTGVESLIIMSLLAYGLYKSTNDGRFKSMTAVFFVSYMVFQTLNGGKSTAVMPFVLFGMAIFYLDRKIPVKLLIGAGVVVVTLVLFIGAFWAASLSPWDIVPIFYERVTSVAALHLDYLLYDWASNHSFELGNTVWLELKRFVAQLTNFPKEPLFNEFIGNLRSGHALDQVTGVSPELSFFGTAYANFGVLGAILGSLVLGYFAQKISFVAPSYEPLCIYSLDLLYI